jgi:chromosome segregation ATPase
MSAHEDVLRQTQECARAWDREARLLGNVRAGDMADAIDAVLAELHDWRNGRQLGGVMEDLRAEKALVADLKAKLVEQCEATNVMGATAASLGGRVQGLEAEVESCHAELADAYVLAQKAAAEVESLRDERDAIEAAMPGSATADFGATTADRVRAIVESRESWKRARCDRLIAEVRRLRARLQEVEAERDDLFKHPTLPDTAESDRLREALREIAEEAVEVEARDLRRMAQKALAEGE